jgi:hypothetical protein
MEKFKALSRHEAAGREIGRIGGSKLGIAGMSRSSSPLFNVSTARKNLNKFREELGEIDDIGDNAQNKKNQKDAQQRVDEMVRLHEEKVLEFQIAIMEKELDNQLVALNSQLPALELDEARQFGYNGIQDLIGSQGAAGALRSGFGGLFDQYTGASSEILKLNFAGGTVLANMSRAFVSPDDLRRAAELAAFDKIDLVRSINQQYSEYGESVKEVGPIVAGMKFVFCLFKLNGAYFASLLVSDLAPGDTITIRSSATYDGEPTWDDTLSDPAQLAHQLDATKISGIRVGTSIAAGANGQIHVAIGATQGTFSVQFHQSGGILEYSVYSDFATAHRSNRGLDHFLQPLQAPVNSQAPAIAALPLSFHKG